MLFEKYETNNDGKYHLGHMFMDCMLAKDPDKVCQLDAATEEQETCGSVLARSVRLARALRRFGLRPGDVLAYAGRNHLDVHIPYYAALLNGLPVLGVDPYFKYDEIKMLFKQTKPKIAFCQQDTYDDFSRAAADLGLYTKIITFDGGECTMKIFMDTFGGTENTDDFQPAEFDTDKVYAWLVSTSGTTGTPKVAAFKHQPLITKLLSFMRKSTDIADGNNEMALDLCPLQLISSYFNALGVAGMLGGDHCKLQTSRPEDIGHVVDVINKYKPVALFTSPHLVTSILNGVKECDLSCFNTIVLAGSKVFKDVLVKLKRRMRPDAVVMQSYGQTETIGAVLRPNPAGPVEACGSPMPSVQIKLVDPVTGKEITDPNVVGELWSKGPRFTEYYNNPEETAKAITEDGWLKSGDLLYRDENYNYFFVDRIKLLIKYRDTHINPPELEEVIMSHAGVLEAAVTGVPDPADGELPAALVVRRLGRDVSAREIKHLVADKLSASKQLRGGVIFVKELPYTSSGKVARAKLREIAINAHME